MHPSRTLSAAALCVACLAATASLPAAASRIAAPAESVHRDGDDLLTAGLGIDGLRAAAPALENPDAPRVDELRRRAVWTNWRGIVDVAPGGGLGEVYGDLAPVPGREFHGEARIEGARHAHRLLLQLPDTFNAAKPCLVVTASSGSRGIYGAIALAGGWGLPRGCAVAYTDKGAGTDWQRVGDDTVHVPHANSGDHPEADWGRHVLQAAAFGRDVLRREAGIDESTLTVIAVGVSNGGGAVLRAAGDEARGPGAAALDGVVAISPNIHVRGRPALYDVATHAALWMPCALAAPAFDGDALLRPAGSVPTGYSAGCASLAMLGLVDSAEPRKQADDARQALLARGWTDEALRVGALSVAFDLWRAVAAGYASSYLRTGAEAMPFGYRYAARDAQGQPTAAAPTEAALWWSDSSGIPPGNGVALLDPVGADGRVRGLVGLHRLGALGVPSDAERHLLGDARPTIAERQQMRRAIEATAADVPRTGLPILLMHGVDDGLVPEAMTSASYAAWAKREGATLRYWRIGHAQHFDAFLGQPALAARHVPLMPYAYAALDALWAHLHEGAPLPADRDITPRLRVASPEGVAALKREDLGL